MDPLLFKEIRENYPMHRDRFSIKEKEQIYDDWLCLFPCPYVLEKYEGKIKNFLINGEELSLNIKSGKHRYQMHKWCDKMGVEHKSNGIQNNRTLVMKKPKEWRWEYSAPPEILSNYEKKLRSEICDACGKDGYETRLYVHYSGVGPYCEDCLETEKSDDGYPLNAYKFEPIYFHEY